MTADEIIQAVAATRFPGQGRDPIAKLVLYALAGHANDLGRAPLVDAETIAADADLDLSAAIMALGRLEAYRLIELSEHGVYTFPGLTPAPTRVVKHYDDP